MSLSSVVMLENTELCKKLSAVLRHHGYMGMVMEHIIACSPVHCGPDRTFYLVNDDERRYKFFVKWNDIPPDEIPAYNQQYGVDYHTEQVTTIAHEMLWQLKESPVMWNQVVDSSL